MIRFFTRLFSSLTPASAKPVRRTILSVETLETREAPSGMGVAQTLKHISQAIKSKGIHMQVSHVSLSQALTTNGIVLHR